MGQKNQGDNVLCKNWHVLGEKEFQAMSTKRVLEPPSFFSKFKMSTPTPHPFLCGSPPWGDIYSTCVVGPFLEGL